MEFTERKLPFEAHDRLRRQALDTVAVDRPLLAPMYVFLRKNKKFVAVKGPMDFITSDELTKFAPCGDVYSLPPPDGADTFENAAIAIFGVLQPKPHGIGELSPAPFELSDQVLRILGPLWSPVAMVEPYFVWVFTQRLLPQISPDLLHHARDQSVATYETAQIRAAWSVFLALHLGYCELRMLERLRDRVFRSVIDHQSGTILDRKSELDEVVEFAAALTPSENVQNFDPKSFEDFSGRVPFKLISRLRRIRESLIDPSVVPVSVFGAGGFCRVG
jgi:hypothetical protein